MKPMATTHKRGNDSELQLVKPPGEYGHYQLGRKLGAGAYGTVYLATEQQSGRQFRRTRIRKIDIKFVFGSNRR